MSGMQVFFIAFAVSYAGSIPPGTINISVMQLSMQGHRAAALAFGLGAVLVEFIYAGIAVKFLQLLQERDGLYFVLQTITGLGLIGLGIVNLLNKSSVALEESGLQVKKRVGFSKGVLLGIINPLSIPFWLGLTTYLVDQDLISVAGNLFWIYLSGLSLGTFALQATVDQLGRRFHTIANNTFTVNTLPGLLFVLMGVYYLAALWALS